MVGVVCPEEILLVVLLVLVVVVVGIGVVALGRFGLFCDCV